VDYRLKQYDVGVTLTYAYTNQEGLVKRPELTKYARLDRFEATLRCILTICTRQRARQVCSMLGYVLVSVTILK
jgi:hypothetical protein